MSEKKKVIYVKDLIIKADNVKLEPNRRHDHFFGPRDVEQEEDVLEKNNSEDIEKVEEERDEDEKRPPFSWI